MNILKHKADELILLIDLITTLLRVEYAFTHTPYPILICSLQVRLHPSQKALQFN